MEYRVKHGTRMGHINVPASKSYAHRLLISAALCDADSKIVCDGISKDIQATIDCLNALGARIEVQSNIISVSPLNLSARSFYENGKQSSDDSKKLLGSTDSFLKEKHTDASETTNLLCNESGSTLRFLIPVVGALGKCGCFRMEGKLSERPLDELKTALSVHGMRFDQNGQTLNCSGKLTPGEYVIPGNVSSQYISGLLFALPLLDGDSTIKVTGKIESEDYIKMTIQTIESMGIKIENIESGYYVKGNQKYRPTESMTVEKDWSNAAFFVCMGAMSERGITLQDMNTESTQGDKEILEVVKKFDARIEKSSESIKVMRDKGSLQREGYTLVRTIDASTIPDLVPTIAALASVSKGETRIVNASRLRFKESDRLMTTSTMLKNLGADIEETEDGLLIRGTNKLKGGETDSFNDHRIAMAAAVTACKCEGDVVIKGCECTSKSYPAFFEDLEKLEVEA